MLIPSVAIRRRLRAKDCIVDSSLLESVAAEESWLIAILEQFSELELRELPPHWRQFFHDISASTPAIGLLDPNTDITQCETLLHNDLTTAQQLTFVNSVCPMLYAILRVDVDSMIILRPFLSHLLSKVKYINSFVPHDLPAHSDSLNHATPATLPKLPQLCDRGAYQLDKTQKPKVCTKKSSKHRTLTPGIFTITCVHGKILATLCLSTDMLLLKTLYWWTSWYVNQSGTYML